MYELAGTDISDAYESRDIESITTTMPNVMEVPSQYAQQQQQHIPNVPNNSTIQLQQQQQQQLIQQQLRAQQARAQQQQQQQRILASQQQQPNTARTQEPTQSYFEVLGSKKRDIMKLIILSMMVLLAISIHSFVMFLIKEGLASSEMSFKQEIGIRLLYPIVVLFILWNLKASR